MLDTTGGDLSSPAVDVKGDNTESCAPKQHDEILASFLGTDINPEQTWEELVLDKGTTTTDAAKKVSTSCPKLYMASSSISTSNLGNVGKALDQDGGVAMDTATLAVVTDDSL